MRASWSVLSLFFGFVAVGGCKPDVGRAPSLITGPEILAVRGEPAEVAPGATATYRFLLASPSGTATDAPGIWDVCKLPKPPSESNAVASACVLAEPGVDVGATFTAPVPGDACSLFGPNTPAPKSGEPALRPRDPDITGGYYVPVRLLVDDGAGASLMAFAFERIFCGLSGAPLAAIQEYNTTYKKNANPVLRGLAMVDARGETVDVLGGTASVTAGSAVALAASASADSAEAFPVYDSTSQTLKQDVETLRLSWFASDGKFLDDRTDADPVSLVAGNTWTAPQVSESAVIPMWVVLRDSRGGVDFVSTSMTVIP
jgi:hypothetical protein